MLFKKNSIKSNRYNKQRGIALLIILLVLGSGALYALLRNLNQNNLHVERDRKTVEALAIAKDALIGFAVNVNLESSTATRPGELPCPDMTNGGLSISSTNTNNCNLATDRLGRLPWKTLKLPDIRDGYGERLWYAVSGNFKNNTGIAVLNPSTNGTLTIKDSSGTIVHGNSITDGVIAVIFSTGPSLLRQGSTTLQNRTCQAGVNCDDRQKCTASSSSPSVLVPMCNPTNFLDRAYENDNAVYSEATAIAPNANGFIQGDILDTNGQLIVNDKFLIITHDELMGNVEKRVAGEARVCLTTYAYKSESNNAGRYPWPAPLAYTALPFVGEANNYFGRVPDVNFEATFISSGGNMDKKFDNSFCKIGASSFTGDWWGKNKWYNYIFYAIAASHAPNAAANSMCGACLQIYSPNISASLGNKEIVVVSAGREINGQSRAIAPSDPANYFENQNATPYDSVFYRGLPSQQFNDRILFYPK
jgi:hypothetical protein